MVDAVGAARWGAAAPAAGVARLVTSVLWKGVEAMDIEKVLREAGVKFGKRQHPVAYTAQELAAEEHVSGDEVAKPVVVQAGEKNVMCVLPASCKIDLGKLAKALKVKSCRLVSEGDMAKLFPDVEVGAESPFGKFYGLETLVDKRLADREKITFTAGSHRSAIQMDYADYARLAEPAEADFAVHL